MYCIYFFFFLCFGFLKIMESYKDLVMEGSTL